jgi:hypothetical protein
VIEDTINEILSFLLILAIPTFCALVGLRRDKVKADRLKRMNR